MLDLLVSGEGIEVFRDLFQGSTNTANLQTKRFSLYGHFQGSQEKLLLDTCITSQVAKDGTRCCWPRILAAKVQRSKRPRNANVIQHLLAEPKTGFADVLVFVNFLHVKTHRIHGTGIFTY